MNTICREFLPIGDAVFGYMERLQQAGFVAWVPYHEFIESFDVAALKFFN